MQPIETDPQLTRTTRASRPMHLLAAGVPLSLLCDLVSTQPPVSREIAAAEHTESVIIDLAERRLRSVV